jgi:hypothetical protein
MNKFETQLATLPAKELATVDVDLTKAGDTAVNLLEQAKRAVITDEEAYAKGGDLIKIARVEGQKIEDLRKKLSGPYHKVWKFINDAFKVTGSQFDLIKKEIEPKMLAWKKAEDEALARAALETSEEGQDEVIEAAGEAAETLVEQSGQGLARGNFGSSTGTRKVYATNIINQLDFLRALVKHIDDGNARNVEIGSLIEFRKAGLNRFAQDMLEQGVKRMPGAEFTGTDKIRVY